MLVYYSTLLTISLTFLVVKIELVLKTVIYHRKMRVLQC